jgi:hypothetical protein
MDAIDTYVAKITKMHEYISKCRAELSATEDAEFAKRMRQFWSSSNNSKTLLEKIRVFDEETPKVLKAKNKMNLILFIVALLVAFANQYFEFIERSNQIILGIAFFAYIIIDGLTDKLETNNNTARRESWKAQVDFYKHEMICSGGGNVEYENEYIKAQKNDDIESEEIFHKLYLLSVEIAILHGLKSKLQFVKF